MAQTQSKTAQNHRCTDQTTAVAIEALLTAAETVEQWVDNQEAHYEGTDKTAIVGARQTYRRAFNSAYDYNVDSELTGNQFDRAEDIFSEPLTMALEHDISGKDAAEFYRNQAKAMLN